MAKLTLNPITSGYASNTTLNENFDRIETAIENTLSRDGTSPNQMESPIDMNGHLIINQGNPITVSGLVWEGPWITAQVYSVGDIIETSGIAYICIVEHTSGVFATDLSNGKWQTFVAGTLPTQAGNTGKYLKTDGIMPSWDYAVDATSATGSAINPSGTTEQRDASPVDGYFRFNTTLSVLEAWYSAAWNTIATTVNTVLTTGNQTIAGIKTFSSSPLIPVATATDQAVRLDQTVGRNKLINGAYQVAQKNPTAAATITAGAAINYTIDRWYTQSTGQNITAQRVAGTSPFKYAYKLIAGATGPTTTLHGQRIEGKDCVHLVNQNVAVKVNIIGDVNRTVTWTAYYATVEDTFSTKTQIATGSISATTTDTTYQFTFNAGANAGLGIAIEYTTGPLTSSTGYITYSGHQLELGVVSTSYEHIGCGDMELRCFRYLWRGLPCASLNFGAYTTNVQQAWPVMFPTKMRAVPTILYNFTGITLSNVTAVTASSTNIPDGCRLIADGSTASINANFTFAAANYIQAEAEL
jgi:hypothetical protein